MRNKIKITLILAFFTLNTIYALTPSTLFDRDSFVVTSVNYLARRSSIIGIYDSFPTTGANIRYTFNQVDRVQLTSVEKDLYDKVNEELNKKSNLVNNSDGFSANLEIPITIENVYTDTANDNKIYRYEMVDQYKDVTPWCDLRTQLNFGENIFGYTQFAVKDEIDYQLNDKAPRFSYNIDSYSFIPSNSESFEIYQPYKIGLSLGDDKGNFQIGKNRLSMGSGITGNFFIGDNFTKQDYASVSLFSSFINYTLSVTEFDQQSDSLKFDSISFNGENQYRVMNRVRMQFLKNLSLSIYQGAIFQVENINLRMVTPFMFVHNYFNFADRKILSENDEANNIIGAQTKWVINKGNEINFILSFDQIQVFESGKEFPQAYGLLFNYKNSMPFRNGMLNSSLEFVYTSPYLYLNDKYDNPTDQSVGKQNYNYDHILGNNYGACDEIGYSGYYYGPDTIMIASSIDYRDLNKWNLGADLRLRIHGTKGIKFSSIYEDTITDTVDSSFIVGTPETILSFMPKGSLEISNFLSINGYLNFNTIFNHYHDTSSPLFFGIQAKISAQFSFL
jgi:hypothetical protein